MSFLSAFLTKPVSVLTSDGRTLCGILSGFDQYQNLVLSSCHERIWSADAPVEMEELGVYVVRGEMVVVVGERDEESEKNRDFGKERSEGIKPIVHTAL